MGFLVYEDMWIILSFDLNIESSCDGLVGTYPREKVEIASLSICFWPPCTRWWLTWLYLSTFTSQFSTHVKHRSETSIYIHALSFLLFRERQLHKDHQSSWVEDVKSQTVARLSERDVVVFWKQILYPCFLLDSKKVYSGKVGSKSVKLIARNISTVKHRSVPIYWPNRFLTKFECPFDQISLLLTNIAALIKETGI